MKIALVLTVKNEKRLLRNNLLYHKAIGADRIFVYFDNTTDRGKESISDLDFVTINDSVSAKKYGHLNYLEKFTSQAREHHTARQCLNTFDAQQLSKKEGIDWLISLDADELICTDFENPLNLKSFFKSVDKQVEVVTFKTLEALQRKETYGNVFQEEILFKKDRWAHTKKLYDPLIKSKQKFSWWYGQIMGKEAVRIDRGIIPHNVHRFKKMDNSQTVKINKGHILHYHAYDAEDFIKKFKNFKDHPNTFLSGNKVEDIKLLLRDVVNKTGYSEEELVEYYRKNIYFTPKEVGQFQKIKSLFLFQKKPVLQEVLSVRKVFEEINP